MTHSAPDVHARAERSIRAYARIGKLYDIRFCGPRLDLPFVALTGAFCFSVLAMLHMDKAPQHFSIGALAAIELLASRKSPHTQPQTNDLGV